MYFFLHKKIFLKKFFKLKLINFPYTTIYIINVFNGVL